MNVSHGEKGWISMKKKLVKPVKKRVKPKFRQQREKHSFTKKAAIPALLGGGHKYTFMTIAVKCKHQ